VKQIDAQSWLERFCRDAPGVVGALAVVATEGPDMAKLAAWPKEAGRMSSLLVAARVALTSGAPLAHVPPSRDGATSVPAQVVAVPLRQGDRAVAAVAVGLASAEGIAAEKCRHRLREALQSFGQARRPAAVPDAAASLRLLAALLGPARFEESAVAAAAEAATILHADRASVGWLRRGGTEVIAVSQGGAVDDTRQAFRALAEAMDEAIGQREPITYPPAAGDPPRITQAHAALVRSQGGTVCTLPLAADGRLVGALLLESAQPIVVDPERRAWFEHLGTLLGSLLELKHRADLPLRQRLWQTLRGEPGRRRLGVRLAVAAAVAVIAALAVPVPYRIGAAAQLEGATQRALVAPADGYLQQAHVRAGDAVRENQVLVEMADEDLALERRRWVAELEQHENALGAALARADRAQMVVHQAKADEARAQLELADQRLARARVTAPFDGVVIRGDLNPLLGSPVKRGDLLLTVAPRGEFRLIVRVDERDIADVREGASGSLALAALPEKVFPIRVQRVTPVASAADGRNVFEVEARLDGEAPAALRPGLEGVAKIDAGEQPLASIWGRRLAHWVRLALFSWGL
jgi:multidrug resistance efflux pump